MKALNYLQDDRQVSWAPNTFSECCSSKSLCFDESNLSRTTSYNMNKNIRFLYTEPHLENR